MPREAFERLITADVTTLVTGYGPLPAATGVRDAAGVWGDVGSCRTVTMSDGSSANERVLTATSPDRPDPEGRFTYRVDGYTNALRWFASHSDGDWRFRSDERGGTRIRWKYTFQPRSIWLAPALWLLLAGPVRGYMKAILRRFEAGAG
ncbi:MAG: SRPBCC family protein [Planctomycetota bacterium]